MDQGLRPHQIGGLVFNAVLGVGVLTIARGTTAAAGTAAWLSVLLAGGLAMAAAWLAGRTAALWPGFNPVVGAATLWGPWAGRLLGMAYSLYFLVLTSIALRLFGEFAAVFLLPRTPMAVTVAALAAVVAWAGRLRVAALAGLSDVIAFIVLFTTLLFLLIAAYGATTENLTLHLSRGWSGLVAGVGPGLFSLLGFEVVLFLGAHAAYPPSLGRWTAAGVAGAVLFYAASVLACLGHFSPTFIAQQTWPLLNVARAQRLPLRVVEQPEVLLAALWLWAVFSTAAIAYGAGLLALAQATRWERRPLLALLLIVPVWGLSLLPPNLQAVEGWSHALAGPGVLLAVGVPVLFLASHRLRQRRKDGGVVR